LKSKGRKGADGLMYKDEKEERREDVNAARRTYRIPYGCPLRAIPLVRFE
jgi:hypothetical protein